MAGLKGTVWMLNLLYLSEIAATLALEDGHNCAKHVLTVDL